MCGRVRLHDGRTPRSHRIIERDSTLLGPTRLYRPNVRADRIARVTGDSESSLRALGTAQRRSGAALCELLFRAHVRGNEIFSISPVYLHYYEFDLFSTIRLRFDGSDLTNAIIS
jgi:hypothetical protein